MSPFRTSDYSAERAIGDDSFLVCSESLSLRRGNSNLLASFLYVNYFPRCAATKKAAQPSGPVIFPAERGGSAAPGAAFPSVLAETHLLRKLRARLGVIGRDHRIVRRQAPPLAVLLRREIVLCPQMPLERLEFLPVI